MNEAELLVQVLSESAEETSEESGVYVDFSAGRDRPIYTCKCPKCQTIHGNYHDLQTALREIICKRCHLKNVEKLKKEVEKVDEPKKEKSVFETDDPDAQADLNVGDFLKQTDVPQPGEVNKDVCMAAHYGQEFYSRTSFNADGSPARVRVSGRCQTWKTRPDEFRLPVKYGMYQSLDINERNASEFSTIPPPNRPKKPRR